MARSIDEIRSEIDGAISSDDELSGIDLGLSTSRVSVWRLWRNVVSRAILTLESIFDSHKKEVQKLSEQLIYGKEDWYQRQAFEWQYGDTLSVIEGKPVYVPVDLTKRIVTRCSVKSRLGTVVLKVAKGSLPDLQPLSVLEKTAFEYYIDRIKPAGIRTEVVSLQADLVWPELKVYFKGELIPADVRAQVVIALNGFLSSIAFDGVLNVNRFIDAVQQVEGVLDVEITALQVKSPLESVYRPVIRVADSTSGYFKFDPDHSLEEDAQIRMIPQ